MHNSEITIYLRNKVTDFGRITLCQEEMIQKMIQKKSAISIYYVAEKSNLFNA